MESQNKSLIGFKYYKKNFNEQNTMKKINNIFNISYSNKYFPILKDLFNIKITKNGSLNNKFIISKIIEKNVYNDEFSNNQLYFGIIRENYFYNHYKLRKKEIFVKKNTILEPMAYMMGYYTNPYEFYLPSLSKQFKISNYTTNKINEVNNSAYLDTFFTYLASRLVETKKCIHFPLFYGNITAITDKFYYNITEEIDSISNETWFKNNINKLFEIHSKDSDMSKKSNKNYNFSNSRISIENTEEKLTTFIVPISDSDNDSINTNSSDYIDTDMDKLLNTNVLSHNDDNSSISNNPENSDNLSFSNNQDDIDVNFSIYKDPANISDIDSDDEFFNDLNRSVAADLLKKKYNNLENDNYNINQLHNNSEQCLSEYSSDPDNIKQFFLEMKNVPIQLVFMEKLDSTIDKLCSNKYNEHEWLSHIFQLCFALAYVQKNFSFFHNDLHTNNVMYKYTEDEFIYYKINNIYFKIKTYNKIIKIIDFGRSIFTVSNKQYFSDVFSFDGEAYGQYTYPKKDFSNKLVKPNPSFDLCYFAVTLLEDMNYIENDMDSQLFRLLKNWVTDKYNKDVRRYEEFDLYKIIARRSTNAVPIDQFEKDVFKKFIINENDLPTNTIIYEY